MKKRIFFIWSLLLVTIGSFGSSKVYQQVITEQFRNEIAGIALNDSFPSADRFGNLYPGTVAQNIINVLNTDPSGVQLTKSDREYVIAIVSGLRPVWGKMKAVYGFVGGNAWKHKWNWKDMRDLDEAYRLVFSGGITHSASGIQGDGTSGWCNTYLSPSTVLAPNNTHLSIYINNNIQGSYQDIMSSELSRTREFSFTAGFTGFGAISDMYDVSNGRLIANNTQYGGYFISNKSSSTSHKIFRNQLQIGTKTAISNAILPSNNINLMRYFDGSGNFYSPRRYVFITIGSGLTDQEAISMSHIITFSQSILNRQ